MKSVFRAAWVAVALLMLAVPASAQIAISAQHAIKDSDGAPMANFDLAAGLNERLAKLPGQVAVGNLQGDVTLLQFYDLNCPYCREAAADVDALVRSDPKLKLVLVPYAVLSVPSVQGALIEVGASKSMTPAQYLDFHKRIYSGRGLIDGPRVLAAAAEFGLDKQQLAAVSNTEATLNVLRENADFGTAAKLGVTPAYIVGGVVILGHPGLKPLQTVVKSMRTCGKVVC
jgi:protein-disulfide isomerase